jgi:hypothetical protein
MYYDEFTTPSKPIAVKSAVPTPSGTPSKPPVNLKENQKPATSEAAPSETAEPLKQTEKGTAAPTSDTPSKGAVNTEPTAAQTSSALTQSTSLTLAMRQAGEEAAQKAKEVKQKTTETFVGVGKAEAEKKEDVQEDKSEAKPETLPAPISVESAQHAIETLTLAQSPTSTAWKRVTPATFESPSSTAWKPIDVDLPVTTHRGSSVSEASADCIKQIEEDEMIPEEDEDAVED